MKLFQLYDRDIDRTINPAVVAQDRTDETIRIEIEEYVFTDEIINNLYKVLWAVKEKTNVSKTGIWINGYYGSGKSHFLKYVHYCVNPATRERAFNRLTEAVKERDRLLNSDSRIEMDFREIDELRRWYATAEIEDVLFNAQDVAATNRTKTTFTTIFFNMFNQCRGYNAYNIPLAVLFEKYLDEKGAFDTFKKVLEEETAFEWSKDAADVVSTELDTVLDIAKMCVPELDTVALKTTLTNPETYHIDTRRFSSEVQRYIQTKNERYRLLFLVDEVSQFINNRPELLLDLQSIIELLSIECNRQVWVGCTAQQTVEEVAGSAGIYATSDNYGKIMARFETRVSLESTDPAFITQKRILEKNSDGVKYLSELYQTRKEAIASQFTSAHQLYAGFQKEKDFVLSYPFVPYQFKLISQVFDAFQQLEFVVKEVKDNERSVLKITHETAKQTKDREVGAFIPFDAFFNNMMRQNLIHKGNRAIAPALELKEVKGDAFAGRVVKALFMVANMLDKDRMNFASSLDNLTFLMMESIDENKMQLRNKIEKVLEQLTSNNIIREEKGSYYFYNEDEAELADLIKNMPLSQDFRIEKIRELVFPFLKVDNKVRFAGNDFRMTATIDGKQFFGNNGDIQLSFHFYSDDDPVKISMVNPFNALSFCFNELFNKDTGFKHTFFHYCQVEKYLSDSHYNMTATREKSIANFRSRNAELRTQVIEPMFHALINKTHFVSGQNVIEPGEVNGSNAERCKNAIIKHLENFYKYAKLAERLPANADDLRTKANESFHPETYQLKPLSEPEKMVNDFITRQGNEIELSRLITNFGKPPYGWKDTAVIYIVIELNKRGLRDLQYKHQSRYPIRDFVHLALNVRERESLTLAPAQEIPQELINATLQAWSAIFNEATGSASDGNSLFDSLKLKLQNKYAEWNDVKEKCENYPFAKPVSHLIDELHKWQIIREPQRLFETLIATKETMPALIDRCHSIQEFTTKQLEKYEQCLLFCNENRTNFGSLDDNDQAKATELIQYFMRENPADGFPVIKKITEELKAALDMKIKDLRAEVLDRYETGFRDLYALIDELDLPNTVCANDDYKLDELKKLKDILPLENAKLQADKYFDGERRKALMAGEQEKQRRQREAARKSVTDGHAFVPIPVPVVAETTVDYTPVKPKKLLSTKEDVDDYIENIRAELMELIRENRQIYIK